MPETVPDAPGPAPEAGEKRHFTAETPRDSLINEALPDEPGSTAQPSIKEFSNDDTDVTAPTQPKPVVEGAERFNNRAEDPFDDYQTLGNSEDFGQLTDEVASCLEKHHIAILYGSEDRLTDLAFSVASLRFSSWQQKSFDPRARTNHDRVQDVMTIDDLITSPYLPKDGKKLLVVHDLNTPNLTPLVPHDYSDARARGLLSRIKNCENLRVLVITRSDTWGRLMKYRGAEVMTSVARKIELAPKAAVAPPDQTSLTSRINDLAAAYSKPGLITLWCIAWLPNASFDDIVFSAKTMIRYWRRKADDREEILENWRGAWSSILAKIGARQIERSQTVSIELSSEAWANELRRLLRIDFRMFHLEMLALMRESGVLLRTEPELLQVFAMSFARLAKEERQPGRAILVHLIEEWLQNAPEERTLFILTALFCAVVRDDETAFAADILAQLPGNGYPEAAAAILVRCPSRFITQPWFITLYNRILPSLTAEVRLEMLSRLIRLSAVSTESIGDTVAMAHASLSNNLFIEFAARFVEELLLGDRERAARLIALLQQAQANSASHGRLVFEAIRSSEFRDYADRRAGKWGSRNEQNPLFNTWIIRTLVPIVPSVSPRNISHLFGHALYGDDSLRTPHVERPGSPADQVVAMLLTDYGCETVYGPTWEPTMAMILGLLISDHDGAIAVYETLRNLSERFYRVSRVLAVLAPTETSFELSARSAIRKFFDDKSEVVDRLRRLIEEKYFKGV